MNPTQNATQHFCKIVSSWRPGRTRECVACEPRAALYFKAKRLGET